jgi:alkylation response protein AidB-like acyl-CoA dehydrogenase
MAQRQMLGQLMVDKVGWLKNQGIRNTRETSMAKWYCTEAAFQTAADAVQVHGAYGFSNEYTPERHLRNSKSNVIYEGTSQIHELMQGQYALGLKHDQALRCELPAYDAAYWQAEV